MSLFNEINNQKGIIRKLEDELKHAKAVFNMLEGERHDCDHVFSPPMKNYEHEGGICTKCGINEVYACCAKIGAKYK